MSEREIYGVSGETLSVWIVTKETDKCLMLRKKGGGFCDTYRLNKLALNHNDLFGRSFFDSADRAYEVCLDRHKRAEDSWRSSQERIKQSAGLLQRIKTPCFL